MKQKYFEKIVLTVACFSLVACSDLARHNFGQDAATVDADTIDLTDQPSALKDAGSDQPGQLLPSDLKGLSVWLDPQRGLTGSTDGISLWADQSGKANHAYQTIPGSKPTVHKKGLNGHDTLMFTFENNTYLTIDDADSMHWGTDDYLVAEVVQYINLPVGGDNDTVVALWVKQRLDVSAAGVALFGNSIADKPSTSKILTAVHQLGDPLAYVETTNKGYNDGRFHLVLVHRHGSTLELRVDGVANAVTTGPVTDVSAPQRNVFIGGGPYREYMQGEVAEVVAVHGKVSAMEVDQLEQYFRTKFGL